jgi:hypothetical protein
MWRLGLKMASVKYKSMKIMELSLILVGALLLSLLISFFVSPVSGGLGVPNATVITTLTIGEVFPEILNVSVNEGDVAITLAANSSVLVNCVGLIRDYNGEGNLSLVNARLFHSTSTYGGGVDNNTHYRNNSCNYTYETGDWGGVVDDEYHVLANCSFDVQYYALPGVWNCTMWVNDSTNLNDSNSDVINVSELLALEVPSTINYGTVNATDVSDENMTNVSNVGNVMFNLSFSGYGYQENDNLAMNCTLGNIKNISIEHEKYNLTASNPGVLDLDGADEAYKNLTASATVNEFNLDLRRSEDIQDAINTTYWRIYVPTGVAGSCQGNIIFGAVQSAEGP